MNIGIYARKSKFSDKSDSIRNQINIAKEYAQNNFKVTSIMEYPEDEGFSGANIERPGFERLLKDVTDKKIDVLICYKIDRISRNVLDFSSTFDMLQKNGIQFVSVKEQIDTSTPLGRAMMYICSVFAQMERETTAERIKDNMVELAKSGKWAGGKPPIGYKREKITLNGKTHTILTENKDEVPFLNMIYDTFLEGFSLNGLETHFRKRNIKTLGGYYLSSTQIYNILKNPHYVAATKDIYRYFKDLGCVMASEIEKYNGEHGLVVYGRTKGGKKRTHKIAPPSDWIVSVGLHEPVLTAAKWLAAQDRFGKNMIDKTRKHEIGILKGIVKCKCGYKLRVKHKVDKTYNKTYNDYYCQNRSRYGTEACTMKMIGVDELDSKLIQVLKELAADKKLLEKYTNKPVSVIPLKNKDAIKKDIEGIKKKIDNLASALQDNAESAAAKYIITSIEKLDRRLIGLQYELREVEDAEQDAVKINNNIDVIHNKICMYLNMFDRLKYSDKTKYLQEIIKECVWNWEQLEIVI